MNELQSQKTDNSTAKIEKKYVKYNIKHNKPNSLQKMSYRKREFHNYVHNQLKSFLTKTK